MIPTRKRGQIQKFQNGQIDLEANLAIEIAKTGTEQIKKRRKAGLSVFFLKDGRIVEQKPDKSEVKGKAIAAKWITLEKSKRKLILK